MYNNSRNKKGYVLVLAVIIMVIGALMIGALLSYLDTSMTLANRGEERAVTYYAADAGVEEALWNMLHNGSYSLPGDGQENPPQELIVNGNTVEVIVANPLVMNEDIYRITSSATGDTDSTTIESYVSVQIGGPYPCFEYIVTSTGNSSQLTVTKGTVIGDIYASGDLILEKFAHIQGNAYANGYIQLLQDARIDGNATANGDIKPGELEKVAYIDGDAYATGDIETDILQIGGTVNAHLAAEDLPLPSLDSPTYEDIIALAERYEAEADVGPYHPGDYVILNNEICDLGPIHIGGDLIINNNAQVTLMGTVYVDGNIELVNNCTVTGTEVVVAEGDITIENNSAPSGLPIFFSVFGDIICVNNGVVEGVLYAPNGQVDLLNNCSVIGSVVGDVIVTNNNFSVFYDSAVLELPGLPGNLGGGELNILSYTIK